MTVDRGSIVSAEVLRMLMSSPGEDEELSGEIVSIGAKDFAFIGNVKDSRGRPVDTGAGDVFLHQEELLGGKMEVGTVLKFRVVPDERRLGKLRALQAHSVDLALVPVKKEVVFPVSVVTGAQSFYHVRAKKILPEIVDQADNNKPFDGVFRPTSQADAIKIANRDVLADVINVWLKASFAMFESFGVNFDLRQPVTDEERDMIEKYAQSFGNGGMDAAARKLKQQFETFLNTKDVFNYLYNSNRLLPQSVLSVDYLPDMMMAAPVWFARGKEEFPNKQDRHDPMPDEFVQYMCGLGKTQRMANLMQLFNRRTRPFDMYEGDVIPPHIWETIQACSNRDNLLSKFDYLVIATPYHNIASKEWADPNWQGMIDPYLLAFSKDVPEFFFVLGRWSDTGLLPLVSEMTADTVNFTREHLEGIENFSQPYWHIEAGDKKDSDPEDDEGSRIAADGTHYNQSLKDGVPAPYLKDGSLPQFARELIERFEKGDLFPWLTDDTYTGEPDETTPEG
ncbi:hypothetical protein HQ571_01490 [Candidatus Kuenenbacteria bacterium]|nr:hypothetical protein [Candidatus Kuenenbacteria bacterium]